MKTDDEVVPYAEEEPTIVPADDSASESDQTEHQPLDKLIVDNLKATLVCIPLLRSLWRCFLLTAATGEHAEEQQRSQGLNSRSSRSRRLHGCHCWPPGSGPVHRIARMQA